MKPIIKAEIERDLAEGTVAIYVIGFHFPSPFGSAFHSRAGTSFKDCSWVEWKNNSDWFNLQRFGHHWSLCQSPFPSHQRAVPNKLSGISSLRWRLILKDKISFLKPMETRYGISFLTSDVLKTMKHTVFGKRNWYLSL